MTAEYRDQRPDGPYRDAEFIAWLASTGRDHNQFSSGELRLGTEAWEAARARYSPAPAAPMTEEDWRARVDWVLQLHIGLLDPELCERTARFLVREAWLTVSRPALDDRHVLLIAKAVADGVPLAGRLQFADLTWQERWNGATAVAALSQSGPDVTVTGLFGVLRFRLDRSADVAAIVNHARQFADMIEQAGRDFEGGGRYIAQRAAEHELLARWQEPEFPFPEDEDSPGAHGG